MGQCSAERKTLESAKENAKIKEIKDIMICRSIRKSQESVMQRAVWCRGGCR